MVLFITVNLDILMVSSDVINLTYHLVLSSELMTLLLLKNVTYSVVLFFILWTLFFKVQCHKIIDVIFLLYSFG